MGLIWLVTAQLIVNGLSAGRIEFANLALKQVRVMLEQAAVKLAFDVAAGPDRPIIGLAQLLAEANVDGHRHCSRTPQLW